MPFSLKLWQVKGKDLQEVSRETLSDPKRLEEWIVNGAASHDELEWTVVNPGTAVIAAGKKGAKPADAWAPSSIFKDTQSRAAYGDAEAQAALGFMFELGIDAPVDCQEAVRWYHKAADQGNARAQLNLRQVASFGFTYDRKSRPPAGGAAAVKLCRKAAEKGNARAQFNLGQMYQWGNGVAQDFEEAVKWYQQAAEQGSAVAQFQLGECYCNGYGVPQNTEEAVKYWSDAAVQGDAAAQFKLGLCYCNGQGVPQDYAEAVKWYREAAEQGDVKAQGRLGDAYYIGLGIGADYAEAVKWYHEAAEHGDASSQRHLGIMYGLGQGVKRDPVEAYKWYDLAAAQHDTSAIHNRKGLSATMTPAQIAEAKRLSHEFAAQRNGDAPHQDVQPVVVPPVALIEEVTDAGRPAAKTTRGAGVLGFDVMPIGREVTTASGGSIDLLALDAQANLVVLVLRRDKPPQNILAQTLEQAAWVRGLSADHIDKIIMNSKGKALGQAFADHFGSPLPETVNGSHSMIILTSELDDSSDRVVRYLAREHKVPICVMYIALFKTATVEFVGRACG
jgi:TPR repeat protein